MSLKWGDKRVWISANVVPGCNGGVCLVMCQLEFVGVCAHLNVSHGILIMSEILK